MTSHESLALAARIAASLHRLTASAGPGGIIHDHHALAAVCTLRRSATPLTPYEVSQVTGSPIGMIDQALREIASSPAINDGSGLFVGPIERVGPAAQGPDRYAIRRDFDDDPAMKAFLAVVDAVKDDLDHRAAVLPPDHPSAYRPKKSRQ